VVSGVLRPDSVFAGGCICGRGRLFGSGSLNETELPDLTGAEKR
jgi:hypothetical protein